jgi:hypothetical protein
MAGPETLQWPRSLEGAEVSTIDATPRDEGELGEDHSECTAISDCSQELSRRINPVTASPNAVSKPAKRNTTNARPLQPGLPTACQRQAGVWGHSVALGACPPVSPAPTERPELRPAVVARPCQVGRVPIDAKRGFVPLSSSQCDNSPARC